MPPVDPAVLAERIAAVERHLRPWCVRPGLGAPPSYGDAFRRLAAAGALDATLAARLVRAVGLRNLVVHSCADLDLVQVHQAARAGPQDLRAFAAALVRAEGEG